MNNIRTYNFQYNVPAEIHSMGKSDHYIECTAQWNKGSFYPSGEPMVMFEGPVMEKLTRYDLLIVTNWGKLMRDVATIAQEYFKDTFVIEPKSCWSSDVMGKRI